MRRRPLLALPTTLMDFALRVRPTMAAELQVAPAPVDLLLILAVDVSSSITPDEARLQREGYLAALTAPEILAQIPKGRQGAIGLAYVEWSGIEDQRLVLPWTRITTPSDAQLWAEALKQSPLRSRRGTSIAGGLDFARDVLKLAPWSAERRVIDVSGDGVNNGSEPVEGARDRAVAEGIVINGLAIVGEEPRFSDLTLPARLSDYYRMAVIGGPGAFVVAAESFGSFGAALKRKLLQEIA